MYFNGSRCQTSSSSGVVLISIEGKPIPLSFRLEFYFTTNITKYEALFVGLHVTIAMGVKKFVSMETLSLS